MAKPTQAAAESKSEGKVPTTGQMMKIRRGLYKGVSGRGFASVPFGETMVCRSGREYEVRESMSYLWTDPQYAVLWEWLGEVEEVPAVNEGQIPPPA